MKDVYEKNCGRWRICYGVPIGSVILEKSGRYFTFSVYSQHYSVQNMSKFQQQREETLVLELF